ncbi:mercuric transporter MerT family protein [Deferrisoma camini]|uniref:mercuric transporter MerT family protein n=1 Tax=Deferrisoma camini TaxID=1035120 RepID=UPI000687BB1E|nr:mercuric transporter MerT family protein [Deferrisoma camini]
MSRQEDKACALPVEPRPRSARGTAWGAVGAVVSGLLASACCIGPLLAVFLGVSGAGALARFEPYRPWFGGLMVVFLGYGFYRAYWRPRRGEACCTPASLRVQRVILWTATILAAGLFLFPRFLPLLMG